MTVAYAQYAPEPDASDFVTIGGVLYDAADVPARSDIPEEDW